MVLQLKNNNAQNILLCNSGGKLLKKFPVKIGANPLDVSDLATGMYLIGVTYKDGSQLLKQLIIE